MEGGGSFPPPAYCRRHFRRGCLILSAHSAGAVESGVFCIGGRLYFVERSEPNGALTFDVLEWNAQGHVIEIRIRTDAGIGEIRQRASATMHPQFRELPLVWLMRNSR